MAKNNMVTRKPGTKVKPKSKTIRLSKPVAPKDDLDVYGAAAARMFHDPCGADLVPSVYTGDRGYVNRFVLSGTQATGAGQTVSVLAWKPGNTTLSNQEAASGSTSLTATYGNFFPGNVFLAANASRVRCAGFCVTVRPIASPNNVTGTIHFGVVNAQALRAGVDYTADQLLTYCTESVSCSQAAMAPLEVKWCPGSFDDRYSVPFTSDDDSDRNLLLVVTIGLPASTGIQFRATAILEWSPVINLGVSQDATAPKPSICDKDCILRNLKKKDPDWWWSLGKKAVGVAGQLVRGYYTGGPIGMLGAATKFV